MINLQSSRYRTAVQNKPIQTQDLIPIVNDLEALDNAITGSTIVTAPFVTDPNPIVVGDDFQVVAEKTQGQISRLNLKVTTLENNEIKITYYAEINAASGTITKPTNSTIMLDQFFGGVDAVISTISGGKPTGDMPQTAGGVVVDVTSFDTSGNFVLSGIPSAYPCALIYTIKTIAANYNLVDLDYIIEYGEIEVWKENSTTIEPNDPAKDLKLPYLGGGGTQMVVTDNDGLLSAQAIPSGGATADYTQSLMLMGG